MVLGDITIYAELMKVLVIPLYFMLQLRLRSYSSKSCKLKNLIIMNVRLNSTMLT